MKFFVHRPFRQRVSLFQGVFVPRTCHLPQATVHLDRICDNFKRLKAFVNEAPEQWPSVMCVVKADGYGHGLIAVSKALYKAGARAFDTGSVEEGVLLRKALSEQGFFPKVVSLLGAVTLDDIENAAMHRITSVIHCFEQLDMYASANPRPADVALKFNMGMARLGFEPEDLPLVMERLGKMPWLKPELAVSHLANADNIHALEEIGRQTAAFLQVVRVLKNRWPAISPSLANSPGTLSAEARFAQLGPHVRRLGLALYGVNPLYATNFSPKGLDLAPVMEVSAPVLAVRTLRKGRGIGYGHTYVAQQDMRVAIIGVGYADGYSRALGGKGGEVCLHGARARLVGRISMQMAAVDVDHVPQTAVGDTAWLLNGPQDNAVSAVELADAWGTIPYEVLCLLGNNSRRYVE